MFWIFLYEIPHGNNLLDTNSLVPYKWLFMRAFYLCYLCEVEHVRIIKTRTMVYPVSHSMINFLKIHKDNSDIFVLEQVLPIRIIYWHTLIATYMVDDNLSYLTVSALYNRYISCNQALHNSNLLCDTVYREIHAKVCKIIIWHWRYAQ